MAITRDDRTTALIDEIAGCADGSPTVARLGGDNVVAFVRQYFRRVPPDDLAGHDAEDLCRMALDHLELALTRPPGRPAVAVHRNEGPASPTSAGDRLVIDIVTDDMPFLVDTVSIELARHGLAVDMLVHPIIRVRRDGDGRLTAVLPLQTGDDDLITEAVMHVEASGPNTDEGELRSDVIRVLDDVRATVSDWRAMRDRCLDTAGELEGAGRAADPAELAEAADFLRWLTADHFTFIGSRDYELTTRDGDDVLAPVPGSGLGLLRETPAGGSAPVSTAFARMPAELRRQVRDGSVLTLTKAQSRSTVHRSSHLDYVGVKRYGADGGVVGERRFLGLYTSAANRTSPTVIPLLRRKVQEVVKRAALAPGSHDAKSLIEILENYPREELLQITPDELYDTALGILALQERPRVRLFLRRDPFGRFVSCLVYVPRDRYTTAVRTRMQAVLERGLGGGQSEWTVRVTESPVARLHVLVYTDPESTPSADTAALQEELTRAARSWLDDVLTLVRTRNDDSATVGRLSRVAGAVPAAYVEDVAPEDALGDLDELTRLQGEGDIRMRLRQTDTGLRFTLYRCGPPIALSDVLPVLENMGVRVVDERPYGLDVSGGGYYWIYDFGLAGAGDEQPSDDIARQFAEAFAAVWRGSAENDGFNRLVLLAGLTWREITVLRACARYLRQVGTAFSHSYMIEATTANPAIAAQLVALFHARFDPSRPRDGSEELLGSIERALDQVASLDEDRILRNFLRLVLAGLRTNYYQHDSDGSPKPYLSIKFDPTGVPDAPLPLPLFEIWVYSPRMEGVHLRGGRVARGGIRWSDRREDFRTEILGLMKAQMVKNAVIVPVGSKGGFVVKRPPEGSDRNALMAEVVECYRTLMRGMLDITDNLVDGRVIPPSDVTRHDDDDPYLVVAADKGTATFSDIANALAIDYGYWLGDAFASGGSAGYDHKAMGITAKGGWESVKRHFRELGLDTQTDDFTAVGIGDMSGDVFGNGMLLSRHIRLVAAFDHRHIFLDPDPDAASSYDERRRLFDLPRSSWGDYDQSLISTGGGVFPRTAKSIPLSPQVRRALGTDAARLSPAELIRAILRAPVDLLWNGGIGTYVKSSAETNPDAGDRSNDAVRIDATQLRCRVVGEGGNLGFTQRARVEYALAGGKINTDAIDNSAGVDTSDHEVNIKVLLGEAIKAGTLDVEGRNTLLGSMTDEVSTLVLADNYDQTRALSNAEAQVHSMLSVHRRLIEVLEQRGRLNRALEFLPTDADLVRRGESGGGLTRPELSVLLAYAKITFYDDLLESDAPEDPYLSSELVRYFPHPLREQYAEAMQRHPLRREIVATCVTNSLINRAGITFAFRLGEETGVGAADLARAWTAAREMFDLPQMWAELDGCDLSVPAQVQTRLFLEARKLQERATRWLLRNRRQPIDVAATANAFAAGIAALTARLRELLPATDVESLQRLTGELAAAGVPEKVAAWVASCEFLVAAPDIVDVATETGQSVESVARIYYGLDERLGLGWLHDRVADLPREGRWQTLARGALRDDLYALHAGLTRSVLRESPADSGVDGSGSGMGSGDGSGDGMARLGTWTEINAGSIGRVTHVLDEIRANRVADLATMSVALREVRSVLTATG